MKKKIYKIARGAHVSHQKAQEYGEELARLEKELGFLSPENVTTAAEKKDSPLHEVFEWNENSAARKWRLEQARNLLRSIEVETALKDGTTRRIRAFLNVKLVQKNTPERKYINVETVAKSPPLRVQIIEQAKQELIHWKERYKLYSQEFDEIFELIEKVQEEIDFEEAKVNGAGENSPTHVLMRMIEEEPKEKRS